MTISNPNISYNNGTLPVNGLVEVSTSDDSTITGGFLYASIYDTVATGSGMSINGITYPAGAVRSYPTTGKMYDPDSTVTIVTNGKTLIIVVIY
tara:strand:+ start:1139 stop:1420 length:282 start_codon:yes stop_codon:yes gene_type:complete